MPQIEATDADSGFFGEVTYSIKSVSNEGRSKFDIDPNTGELFVTGLVDRDETYVITVEARDNPGPGDGNTPLWVLYSRICSVQCTWEDLKYMLEVPSYLHRSSVAIVNVGVVLANNLAPSIPASQYSVIVSEGVVVDSKIFTVPVSGDSSIYLEYAFKLWASWHHGFFWLNRQGEDPEDDALQYQIIRGNDDGKFTIDPNTWDLF